MLDDLHTRLSGVVIECLPYDEFIMRYDRATTLFYLDPPYFGGEDDYGKNVFERADFEKLSELLRGLSGRFILSLNDTPEVRQIFDGFSMDEAEVNYSIARQSESRRAYGELIISNL